MLLMIVYHMYIYDFTFNDKLIVHFDNSLHSKGNEIQEQHV